MSDGRRQPWDRQFRESTRVYAHFCQYRDAGVKRSLAKVSQQVGVSRTRLENLSKRWNWVARVEAFDDYQQQVDLLTKEQNRISAVDRQGKLASALLTMVARRIVGDPAQGISPLDPGKLTATDVKNLLELAIKTERLVLGLPTEVQRQQGVVQQIDLDKDMTNTLAGDPEALSRYQSLLERLARGPGQS